MASSKISVYSLADLKNTTDDAVPNYLESLKFKQSHRLTMTRLGLGYTAFFLSAATFAWDYYGGFESTKYYTAAAVLVYMCLNGALTYHIWFNEKGKIYVGESANGEKIEIASSTTKNVPIYNLTITFRTASQPTIPTTIKLSRPFSEWFDASGNFITLPFQQMFASAVPIIGMADPKKAAKPGKSSSEAIQESSTVDRNAFEDGKATRSGASVGAETPVSTSAGKKSKGKKKA